MNTLEKIREIPEKDPRVAILLVEILPPPSIFALLRPWES
jgi:hypothetical protein